MPRQHNVLLRTGDVTRLRTARHYTQAGIRVDWSAPDGRVFKMLLLGMEPIDGSGPLDIERALNKLGWFKLQDPELPPRDDSYHHEIVR